ncbi:MAG: methylmalonyl-CoA mutase family protein [Ferruginibacter sp.]
MPYTIIANSLHTNAYDRSHYHAPAESVRRAMAIQLIINRELGTAKNETVGFIFN